MTNKEAKDFLVQQVVEQAERENVPLSDIEKRMMYFTESDRTTCANPAELNEEFEAECDSGKYEAKMARLMHHAHDRLKAEDPQGQKTWDAAIRRLSKGDHYVLVLWRLKRPSEHRVRDFFKLLGSAVLLIAGLVAIFALLDKYNITRSRLNAMLPAPSPGLAVAIYVGLGLLGYGGLRLFMWGVEAWLAHKAKGEKERA